jgi:hypothetical protein
VREGAAADLAEIVYSVVTSLCVPDWLALVFGNKTAFMVAAPFQAIPNPLNIDQGAAHTTSIALENCLCAWLAGTHFDLGCRGEGALDQRELQLLGERRSSCDRIWPGRVQKVEGRDSWLKQRRATCKY